MGESSEDEQLARRLSIGGGLRNVEFRDGACFVAVPHGWEEDRVARLVNDLLGPYDWKVAAVETVKSLRRDFCTQPGCRHWGKRAVKDHCYSRSNTEQRFVRAEKRAVIESTARRDLNGDACPFFSDAFFYDGIYYVPVPPGLSEEQAVHVTNQRGDQFGWRAVYVEAISGRSPGQRFVRIEKTSPDEPAIVPIQTRLRAQHPSRK